MKKAKRVPRRAKKHPIAKGLGGVPDVASLTETVSNRGAIPFYNSNVSYRLYNMSLLTCPRATLVGQAYQEYRIRRITLLYKASNDTFSGGNNVVPQLYYMVDKRGAVPFNFTADTLAQMGSTPKRFDDKLRKVSWTPSVLQSSLTDPLALTTAVSSAQISPWLPTNGAVNQPVFTASDVDHFGVSWIVLLPTGVTQVPYDIDIMVDFEFRKPRWNSPLPSESPPATEWNAKPKVLGE